MCAYYRQTMLCVQWDSTNNKLVINLGINDIAYIFLPDVSSNVRLIRTTRVLIRCVSQQSDLDDDVTVGRRQEVPVRRSEPVVLDVCSTVHDDDGVVGVGGSTFMMVICLLSC